MKPGQPSRTAEYMAFFRAWESLQPNGTRLFADPFAPHFVRASLRAALWLSRIPALRAAVGWYADRRLPGARTSAIARTRLIDEAVCESLRGAIRQIAVLGAGFDCRAYRLPGMESAAVFEVDHPSTLAWKLSRLRRMLPDSPKNVHYVGIDFNRESLPELLRQAGFDSLRPAVFLWEGVTNYLTSAAVDSVLRFVSGCAPRSRIIFTYVHSGALDGSMDFEGAAKVVKDVAQLGEPWTFGLDPVVAGEFLRERGLRLDRDASAREYREQFYGMEARGMKGYDFYHVVLAHVAEGEEKNLPEEAAGASGKFHA